MHRYEIVIFPIIRLLRVRLSDGGRGVGPLRQIHDLRWRTARSLRGYAEKSVLETSRKVHSIFEGYVLQRVGCASHFARSESGDFDTDFWDWIRSGRR